MNKKYYYIALTALIISYCGKKDIDDTENQSETQIEEQKFFSLSNSGKWADQRFDHSPMYEIKQTEKNKIIDVKVSLKVSGGHYIETFVLLDHNRNELQKVNLNRGDMPKASFELPLDYRAFVYVIAKCNQHDMWEAKIVFD
ncbi:MAG: desulfoferrodoxin family protein [Spirochaetia bacterium]|nr:desulfoferrodoxin family protein [Spirochaetia bacterium]